MNLPPWAGFGIAALFVATILTGTLGWLEVPVDEMQGELTGTNDVSEAFFRSFLTLGADSTHADVTTFKLRLARYLGLVTSLAATLLLAAYVFRDQMERWRATGRRDHVVLLGASPFALGRALNEARFGRSRLTVIDTPEVLARTAVRPRQRGVIWIAADPDVPAQTAPLLGRDPARLYLGASDAMLNFERALVLGPTVSADRMSLRIDNESLSRDLGTLHAALGRAQTFSEARAVAQALVTGLAAPDMADVRGQRRVHAAIIGFGRIGLAIAEELALRCHRSGQQKVKLSIFDKDPNEAAARLDRLRPGLRRAAVIQGPNALDGLRCGLKTTAEDFALSDPLLTLEREDPDPITVLIVCAGDDTCNAAIATRLRRLQTDNDLLRAPILMRARGSRSMAPDHVECLTEGVVLFGGERPDGADMQLQFMLEELAANLHSEWGRHLPPERQREFHPWSEISEDDKRTNRRAALSAVEIMRSVGLVPPHEAADFARLAGPRATIDAVLKDAAHLETLARTEHDRWVAERAAEGWTQAPDGEKDKARKLHDCMVPFDRLSGEMKAIDRRNVEMMLAQSAGRNPGPGWRFSLRRRPDIWRRRFRIGVMGAMHVDQDAARAVAAFMRDDLADHLPAPLDEIQLEVVSPMAPGFDRIGATALLGAWQARSGRRASLLRIQMAGDDMLDALASNRTDPDALRAETQAVTAVPKGVDRTVRMLPPGVAERDLKNRALFDDMVLRTGKRVAEVSDLVLVYLPQGTGARTRQVLEHHEGKVVHLPVSAKPVPRSDRKN